MAPFYDYPFRALREGIRNYYRDHLPLTAEVRKRAEVNPGNGCVIIGWNRLVGELAAHPVIPTALSPDLRPFPGGD